MQYINRWIIVTIIILAALALGACTPVTKVTSSGVKAAIVEKIEGTEFNRLTLTEKAAQRLGIETIAVHQEQVNGMSQMVIPYGAVVYDVKGNTWIYTTSAPLTYVRTSITIAQIKDDMAVLKDALAANTEVVTVGVSELYGLDTGVG
jgi:hypothetical protein